jgi:hypothetical protein
VTVDEATLRAALAGIVDADADAVQIEYALEHGELLVFSASVPDASPIPLTGTFDGTLERDLDRNIARLLMLARRDSSLGPKELAAAVGMLEDQPGQPFLDREAIELGGDPDVMAPPRFIDVDGVRTLEFWNASARHAPWRTRLKIHEDGTFTREQTAYTAVKAERP